MSIILSENAVRHVNRCLTERGAGIGIRLSVKSRGCSGYSYRMEYIDAVDTVNPDDKLFEQDGIKLVVDAQSLPYVEGTEVDYVRDGLSEGFRFSNPNERDRCGCGESFRI